MINIFLISVRRKGIKMKTDVLLREEQEFRTIAITDHKKPHINDELLGKWQNIIDLTANIIDVSAALLMKITRETSDSFA